MREKRKGLPVDSGLPVTMKVDGFLKNEKKMKVMRKWEKGGG